MLRGKKNQSLPRNKESRKECKSVEQLNELTESGQETGETFQQSEPSLGAERDTEPPEDLGVSFPDKQRPRSSAVTEWKQARVFFGETQSVAREHLVCSICEQGVKVTDLYLLSCCHSVCLNCVRIEEGYYKCPKESCHALASVQNGELRANLLSRDYKRAQQQMKRGDKRQGTGSKQESPLCERCYSAQSLTATHLCLECDRLMCPVCLDIHNRGDGTNHLVTRTEELGGYKVEQVMGEMQARLGLCGRHSNRTLVHFCTECDAFLCDGCLVEDHRQHVTTSVETRLSELKARFLSYIRSSYSCTLGFQERSDTLKEVLERTLVQEEELVQRIIDSYDDMLRRVERKRDELIHEAWAHFSRSKRELTLRIQHLEREIGQLVRSNTYLTSSAQLCSVRTLEENSSHLTQSCSLQQYTELLSREMPAYEQLKLKLTPQTEKGIRDSGTLVTAVNYSNIRPDLVLFGERVLTRPYGVVVDSCDRLIVADGPSKCVQVFKEENKVSEIWDEEHLGYPWGLALSEDSLFVTDGVKHSVVKYSLDGTFQCTAGLLGDGRDQLDNPMGISCGALVYVCDSGNNRLQVLSQELEWKGTIGGGKLDYPRDVALTPEGMLIVLDEGNPCLHIYNLKGNLVGNYGTRGLGKTLVNPFFIAADGEGGIIVSDYGGDTVKVLSLSDGKISYRMDSGNLTGIDVKGPNGVFVDNRGRVLLTCGQSNQLIRFYFEK